jgi:hypothetical protein
LFAVAREIFEQVGFVGDVSVVWEVVEHLSDASILDETFEFEAIAALLPFQISQ